MEVSNIPAIFYITNSEDLEARRIYLSNISEIII